MFSILSGFVRSPTLTLSHIFIPNQQNRVSTDELALRRRETDDCLRDSNAERVFVPTSDGQSVETLYFPGKDPVTKREILKNRKTIVIFPGIGAYHYYYRGLAEQYRKKGINVVILSYRGILNNTPSTPRGIVIDGESVVDFLERNYHVPRNHIVLHAHSLGGAFSSIVAANRIGIGLINDRSFSQLSLPAQSIVDSTINNFIPRVISRLLQVTYLTYGFVKFVLCLGGWDFNVAKIWKQIPRRCVIYHHRDPVIPRAASLFEVVHRDAGTHLVELNDECSDPHSRLLSENEIDRVLNIMNF